MSKFAVAIHQGPVPVRLYDGLQAYAERFDLAWQHDDRGFCLSSQGGKIVFSVADAGLTVTVTSPNAATRHQLCEGAVYALDQLCPAIAAQLAWDGSGPAGDLPAGMYPAQLRSVERISANYLRVTLDCPQAESLMSGGMHFSLILPPRTRPPVWPALDARGRTVWPDGENTLHRAVFTFTERDADHGSVSFDLFTHQGSPATDWALGSPVGSQVMLSGPGGGDIPAEDHLVMMGDETALPAIRAILQSKGNAASGAVWIETGDVADRVLGPVSTQVKVHWLDRSKGETLNGRLAEIPFTADDFIWIAAESDFARTARRYVVTERGHARKKVYIAGYWTDR